MAELTCMRISVKSVKGVIVNIVINNLLSNTSVFSYHINLNVFAIGDNCNNSDMFNQYFCYISFVNYSRQERRIISVVIGNYLTISESHASRRINSNN